ncbi:hypothetical protein FRC08_011806 [Ceratobasidium sp. 394]|nr:hypothetical protein FRC08_011806 [Ceratobasidium sp. 394]
MPYSENAHYRPIASLLSTLSNLRAGLGSLAVPLLPALRLPIVDLRGKQAIVTGANSGVGFEVAKALAGMGACVVLACRNPERGEQARRKIMGAVPVGKVELEILDCARFESVREFVNRWDARGLKRVDILINNAGGILNTLTRTQDGFEEAYQSNHLAHALLTHSLLKHGYFAPDARIVTVSSIAFFSSPPLDQHNTDSSDITVNYKEGEALKWETMVKLYDRAKASQAVWSMVLQRKLEESGKWKDVVVQVCHPGKQSPKSNAIQRLTPTRTFKASCSPQCYRNLKGPEPRQGVVLRLSNVSFRWSAFQTSKGRLFQRGLPLPRNPRDQNCEVCTGIGCAGCGCLLGAWR